MTFISKGRKKDILGLCRELGLEVDDGTTIAQLKDNILKMKGYDENFAKGILDGIIAEREQMEEKIRIQEEREYELRRLQPASNTDGITSTLARKDVTKLVSKLEEDGDVQTFLSIFEKQVKRLQIDESEYVTVLLGLVPLSIAKIINQEEASGIDDYQHIKQVLLKRYKWNTETFRRKFFTHTKNTSWREFIFELRTYLNEWLAGTKTETFDDFKELLLCDRIKSKTSEEIKNHFLDKFPSVNKSDELLELLEQYEAVRIRPSRDPNREVQKQEKYRGGHAASNQPVPKRTQNTWLTPRAPLPRNWTPPPNRMQTPGPRGWDPPPMNQPRQPWPQRYQQAQPYWRTGVHEQRPPRNNGNRNEGSSRNNGNRNEETRATHHGDTRTDTRS